jgi:thymidylate synthase
MVNIRSNDVPLGLPFNIASYALLLEIIAKIVDMIPEDLIINIGDAHIYLNQMEGVQEQLTREPFELPTLKIEKTDEFWNGFDVSMFTHLDVNDFTIENYKSHPPIKLPLSN